MVLVVGMLAISFYKNFLCFSPDGLFPFLNCRPRGRPVCSEDWVGSAIAVVGE